MPCWWQPPSVLLSVSTSCLNFWEDQQIRSLIPKLQPAKYSIHFIVGILVFGFISPIAEELLFRGVIYGYLRRFMISNLLALSALIFGVPHELRAGHLWLYHRLPHGLRL